MHGANLLFAGLMALLITVERRLLTRVALLVAGAAIAISACGQQPETPAHAAFKTLRYDEDYSYLRDPPRRTEALDALKYIPLNGDGTSYLTLGGEVRERYEYFQNYRWGEGPQDKDGYLLQRYMLHADAHFGSQFRVFAQLKSGLETDRNGGPRSADRDDLDPHQLFFDVKLFSANDPSLTLRVGRQELAYGSSRLISVREAPNVRQSFDGGKAILKLASWRVDAFAVRPVETKPGVFDDGPDPHREFWGLYAVTPVAFLPGGNADVYYLGLERDAAQFDQGTAHEMRHSIGTRIWGRKSAWDYNLELVYQFGTFGDGTIRAWTAASETAYSFTDRKIRPRIGLRANITSGDNDPKDADLETFNPLFPRGTYFSETRLIGPANHIDVHPFIELHPMAGVTATVDWDFFWRESTRDGIYGNAVSVVRSGQSSEARYVGSQTQCLVGWDANRHFSVTAAYAHFFAGAFLKESGPRKDVDYGSAWVSYKF
jgi:hypothetical protein